MIRFWKYHGIGNDFVVLDRTEDRDMTMRPDLCRNMCDRHIGIGADGVLYIFPGKNADISMRIINADGSEAEMCGNGIRCVAKYVYDAGIISKKVFTVNTLAGVLKAEVSLGYDGRVATAKIDMGAPELNGRKIPVDTDEQAIDIELKAGDVRLTGTAVSMGNPHFVTFTPLNNATIDRLGPLMENHPFFPNRANIEFASVKDGKIYLRVYERGASWTLACGTGACATTVAAALNGLVPFDEPVDVHLPGGWLKITASEKLDRVLMEGPAELVFSGDFREQELHI